MDTLQKIDHSALRANQIVIITLNILAFLLNQPWLAVFVAVVMLAGTLFNRPGFGFIYHQLLKPARWVQPEVLMDNPEPHRFAQGLGGTFMAAGNLALFLGLPALGWGLIWLVAGLAALNAFAGFCVGCMLYYWLGRFHMPGFSKSPPDGSLPGLKPKKQASHEA